LEPTARKEDSGILKERKTGERVEKNQEKKKKKKIQNLSKSTGGGMGGKIIQCKKISNRGKEKVH